MTAKEKIAKLQDGIQKLQLIIKEIRNKCPHKNVIEKFGGSTGNYDPSNDCFWKEVHCIDCDFREILDYNKETHVYEKRKAW